MATRLRRSLTFANVCSFTALTLALGTGGAYAANTVFSTDIVDGEVKTADIGFQAVVHSKLGPASVSSAKLIDGTIANADLAAGSVNGASVFDNSLTTDDLATSSVNSAEIAPDAVGATDISDNAIDGGEIVNGSVGAVELSTSSVGSEELATGAATEAKIGSNAVNGAKVANNSLTSADLAGADVNGTIQVPTGTVANGRCGNYSIGVGGAKAGEVVVITNKAALQNGLLLYGSRVPSDGTVTMTMCNMSGGTQNALVDFPIRITTFG
jgi:hypothetical protein